MKNILILAALLFSLPAFSQYPANPTTKVDLGRQTTGDGLTFRGAGAPAYTPSSKNNAWVYLDTLTGITHYYYDAAWRTLPNDKTVYPLVKNVSGGSLTAGTVVSINDADPATGDKINIVAAEGDGTKPAKLILGVLRQTLANNGEGYVQWFGRLNGLSLSTLKPVGETWADGDILYLSGTINGGLTKVIPTKPALDIPIALILSINGNNLTLLVRPTLGEELGELHDVSVSGATDGQVLTYQSSTGLWIPTTVSGGGGGISDGDKGDITVSLSGTVWTIDAGVVTDTKLATGAVTETKLANDAVTAAKIATGAVGETELATDAVTSAKIAADAVGTSEIATDAVTALEIATGAVGTDELASNSVTSVKIIDNQVIESKILAGAVTETKLGTGAVTETKIGTGAVTNTKLGADAVTADKIAADAVGTSEIAADAVTAAKIATGAVGSDEIATAAVGADEIATGAVGSDEIATGAVNSDELATGAVIEAKIGTGAVTEGKIGTGAVTETKLGTGAVTETKIANDAVTAAKIATGAVGADELASTAVTPGAYTSANITVDADGRITAAANGSGGGGTPAGNTGEIQFNNAGAFGANSNLFWDAGNSRLGVGVNTSLMARAHVRGSGTSNTSVAFEVENNTPRKLLEVRDDGLVTVGEFSGSPNRTVVIAADIDKVQPDTNINLTLTPRGTGALIAGYWGTSATGSIAGGNARGARAVDLQMSRTSAAQVASGIGSSIVGGTSNTSSGRNTVVSGGNSNSASGFETGVFGGQNNSVSGGSSVVLGGSFNSIASDLSAVIGGYNVVAYLSGQVVNGLAFSPYNAGDAQTSRVNVQAIVTGDSTAITQLNLIGAGTPLTLRATNRLWNAKIQCSAFVATAGTGSTVVAGDALVQSFELGIKRVGSSTSLVGNVITTLDQRNANMTGSAFLVDADDSAAEALRIRFKPAAGASATTVTRCNCSVYLSEIAY